MERAQPYPNPIPGPRLVELGRPVGSGPETVDPEIGPHRCPLCGGWMWIMHPATGTNDSWRFGGRTVTYRCAHCHVSRGYLQSEDGTQVALERR